MEFVVPGVDAFIDLSRSYFTMKLRLRKQNGTNIDAGDVLYPANNLAHTLIKQLTCHLNGTLISPQNDSYAYKAYLETVLNYNAQEAHTLLRPQGWFPHPTRHDDHWTGFSHPLDGQQRGRSHPARPLYGAQSPQESGRPLVQRRTSPLPRRGRAHLGLQTAFGIVPSEQTVGKRIPPWRLILWGCLPATIYPPPRIARVRKPTWSTRIRTGGRDSIGWPCGRRATTPVKSWTVLACR